MHPKNAEICLHHSRVQRKIQICHKTSLNDTWQRSFQVDGIVLQVDLAEVIEAGGG